MPELHYKERRSLLESDNYKAYVSTVGYGSIKVTPNRQTFRDNQRIRITASAEEGWHLHSWHNIDDADGLEARLILEEHEYEEDIIAEFRPDFDIIITGSGEIDVKLKKGLDLPGEYLTLSVVEPASGYYFTEWSDNVVSPELETTEVQVFDFDQYSRGGSTYDSYPDDTTYYRVNDHASANFEKIKYYIDVSTTGKGKVLLSPDEDYYTYDYKEIELFAAPGLGWGFDKFEGEIEGFDIENNRLYLELGGTIDAEEYTYDIEAFFNPRLDIKIEIESEEEHNVDLSEIIEIVRTPDKKHPDLDSEVELEVIILEEDWRFIKWSDNTQAPDEEKTSVIMNEPKEVSCLIALIEPDSYMFDIDIIGEGSVEIIPDKQSYFIGEDVTVKANPAYGWQFAEWDNSELPGVKEIDILLESESDFEIGATFGPMLNVNTDGVGEITIEPDKDYYSIGEEVTVTVDPTEGYEFDKWAGEVEDKESKSTTVVMDGYRNITAELDPLEYTFDVSIIEGEGDINITPEKDYYYHGESLVVEIIADNRYDVSEWSGDVEDSSRLRNRFQAMIDIVQDTEIEVELYEGQYLDINIWGMGKTEPSEGQHKYIKDSEVTIQAIPEEAFFVKWEGDIDEEQYYKEEIVIKLDRNKKLTAIFDSNSIGFFNIAPNEEFEVSPGETIEIDVSAYFRWGSDDKIEYVVENLPPQAEFDRENLLIKWTPIDKSKLDD